MVGAKSAKTEEVDGYIQSLRDKDNSTKGGRSKNCEHISRGRTHLAPQDGSQ